MTPSDLLAQTVTAITSLDADAMRAARERQAILTKPAGSLGVLEETSVRLAGITGLCPPPVPQKVAVAVFAADHGVVASGVTPWPQSVTTSMVENFRAGGAAVNVLSRQIGADVTVIDMGMVDDVKEDAVVRVRKVRPGTADLAHGPAMTRDEALQALGTGIRIAEELAEAGYELIVTGDMGIGNTTASACLIAHFTGLPAAEITGRGTGIDDAMLSHKTTIVAEAVARIAADADPVEVLAEVGGLEHAGLAGLILGAAARNIPVVLDGVIAGSASLVAQALSPEAVSYCLAGHRSVEPGHTAALAALGLRPLVELDLRLGEGSGAVLAVPLIRSAAAILAEMATFADAGIEA
ncbi:nicotinate-nucleotide--dimethylbenzimidazole phosphoribosyltransferase [Nocardioides sp. Bht2]|uniref:nicotinate-nucleotide--dimethylbenzimidazole phosphoribosyltransferase n=1 Tax=Nocardioides sp. Bht2 TaxID=3392297 RepID=UPI0039B60878